MTTALANNNKAKTLDKKPRPLKALAPMIRKELKAGFQAGERHWKIVGRLLNGACVHFPNSGPNKVGETFHEWVGENFQHPWTGEAVAERTVRRWMSAAKSSGRTRPEMSLDAVTDRRHPKHKDHNPKLDWRAGVRGVQRKINLEALRLEHDDMRKEEQERAELARKIVDAGYRALAPVVHPDKPGGSTRAMAKSTSARQWLNELVRSHS